MNKAFDVLQEALDTEIKVVDPDEKSPEHAAGFGGEASSKKNVPLLLAQKPEIFSAVLNLISYLRLRFPRKFSMAKHCHHMFEINAAPGSWQNQIVHVDKLAAAKVVPTVLYSDCLQARTAATMEIPLALASDAYTKVKQVIPAQLWRANRLIDASFNELQQSCTSFNFGLFAGQVAKPIRENMVGEYEMAVFLESLYENVAGRGHKISWPKFRTTAQILLQGNKDAHSQQWIAKKPKGPHLKRFALKKKAA